MAAEDPEVSPGIKASGLGTLLLAKGASVFSGHQLGKHNTTLSIVAGAVALVAETDYLKALPTVTGVLVDAGLFLVGYLVAKDEVPIIGDRGGDAE